MTNWDGIDEAVAVADCGSFAAAAARLGMSTSHVSRAIARLEDRLGAPLYHRTTRRVSLTDTGRTFTEQCRRLIQEREELLSFAAGSGEPQGELRLTCSISLGERFIAPIVDPFAERHPRLTVILDFTNRIVDLIGEGYDIGIRTRNVADSRLVGKEIARRPLETCAAPSYLAAHGTPRAIGDLARHNCLAGVAASWHFLEHGTPRSFAPAGRWRCNSGNAVLAAALAGRGICQLATCTAGSAKAASTAVTKCGGISGLSPWRLTTTSGLSPSTASAAAQRSVPLRRLAAVADLTGAQGRVLSFEPNPNLAGLLRKSIEVNGFSRFTDFHELALGGSAGTAGMDIRIDQPGGGRMVAGHGPETGSASGCAVGDGAVRVERFDRIPHALDVEFIKMDVEGFEPEVWKGMTGLLERGNPLTIFMEFTVGRLPDPAGFLDAIMGWGFTLEIIRFTGQIEPITREALLNGPKDVDHMLVFRRG